MQTSSGFNKSLSINNFAAHSKNAFKWLLKKWKVFLHIVDVQKRWEILMEILWL